MGVHVTDLYPEGRCFLKGFFNALEAFRFGRDDDGWRVADANDLSDEMAEAAGLEANDSTLMVAQLGSHAEQP